jgi:putative CocE/NonD family hydrolase
MVLSNDSIKIEFNVPARMRDGINLYADVYRPDNQKRYPAILTRLPYNKSITFPTGAGYMNPVVYARAGYAVVVQDVRGTGASEGKAFFWRQEIEDGYDSVESIAAQPWCDGNVGMFGFSYFGYTQWAAAVAQPPHLKAICPGMTEGAPHLFPFSHKGDKFKLQTHMRWCLMISILGLLRSQLPPRELKSLQEYLFYLTDHIDDQLSTIPLKDSPAIKKIDELGMRPLFSDILAHFDDEKYWDELGGLLPPEKVTVPALHIAGWHDVDMTPGVLASFVKIRANGGSDLARQNQKLVLGPWVHSTNLLNLVGQLDFGQVASGAVEDITGKQLRWFDHWLKGIDNGVQNDPPVRIFVMGDNKWRNENEWPLARTQYTNYYFHSRGRANSLSGDGALNTVSPAEEPGDGFLYDPRNPVPSNEMGPGAFNQQEVEQRADVLVYSSAPLESDLEVTGPVRIILYASTSAVDTDFSGKLVDVWPSGRAYNVAEGITRAYYRRSMTETETLKPEEVYEYSIDLGGVSNVFKAGHRIRLEVSSSNFPKWERNLNTGRSSGQEAAIKLALQTVFHNKQSPSHIVLPVIP